MHYCRQHLASFKIPRRVIFVNDWPMTAVQEKYNSRAS
jgi:non-ribosomal peptide synthetase component E (peptide arylation enzyme)